MGPGQEANIVGALERIVSNTNDKVCLGTKELVLSNVAKSLSFAGLENNSKPKDVFSVTIKVKAVGSPTNVSDLVRYTQALSDTPTTTHGMWQGSGDYFEINNNPNVINSKFISSDGGTHILTVEYYGKN